MLDGKKEDARMLVVVKRIQMKDLVQLSLHTYVCVCIRAGGAGESSRRSAVVRAEPDAAPDVTRAADAEQDIAEAEKVVIFGKSRKSRQKTQSEKLFSNSLLHEKSLKGQLSALLVLC